MSDTSSEVELYRINSIEELEKAKRQVKTNYMCKCCDIKYCDECLKPKIRISMCFKSFPTEVLDTICSFIRCDDCIKMLKVIEGEETPDQCIRDHGCVQDTFGAKAYYYTSLNAFPPQVEILEIMDSQKVHDEWRHSKLERLYNGLKDYENIYNWKDDILYNNDYSQDMETAYEELNLLLSDFIKVLGYIDSQEIVKHNILYGEGFGMDIADELNEIFFNDSDSESEYYED